MAGQTTSGNLARYPLPRLLVFVLRKGFTGAMKLDLPDGPVTTFFSNGWPEFTDFKSSADVLGQIMLERGMISSDQYHGSLEKLAEGKGLHGRILMEMGLITHDQLVEALKLQLHRKLVRLFQFDDAPFELTLDRIPDKLAAEIEHVFADPLPVIAHGLKNHYTVERLKSEMSAIQGMSFKLDIDDRKILNRIPLEPGEEDLLQLLEERHWLLEDFLLANASARVSATALVYSLWAIGLLDIQPAEAATRPSEAEARFLKPKTTKELQAMADRATSSVEMEAVEIPPKTGAGATGPGGPSDDGSLPPLPEDASEQAAGVYEELKQRLQEVGDQNLFEILGVEPSATRQQVKEAYLKLAKKFHPDRVAALELEAIRLHTDRLFQRISEAFTTLLDDKKRDEYRRIVQDKTLGGGRDRARQLLEAEVHFQKGEVFFRKGDLDNAEKMFKAALQGNPEEGEHHAMLAWTLYYKIQRSKGKSDKASVEDIKKQLRHAIELSPKCARAHFYLGKVLQQEGAQEGALDCFEKAVAIKPHYLEPAREINVIRMRKARGTKKTQKSSLWDRLKGK